MLCHGCYTAPMNKMIDTLGHLPNVYAGPWTEFRGCYERRVSFNCEHRNRHYAVLTVYGNAEGGPVITVKIGDRMHEMAVGENVDAFSTANETLLALAGDCGCCTGVEWGVL